MICYKPLGNNLIIKQHDKPEEISSSGLILNVKSELLHKKPDSGTVIAISDNLRKKEITIGDTVFFGKFSGTNFIFNDEKYIWISYNEIIGKYNPNEIKIIVKKSKDLEQIQREMEMNLNRIQDNKINA
jgi:co-chaperonin GroES (HSP10)